MAAVRMVQVPGHQVVQVIAVRNRFMTAAGSMFVSGFMPPARMIRRASRGIRRAQSEHMLVHMVAMRLMQVPVVQIVDMAVVGNSQMPAAFAMNVGMAFVNLVFFRQSSAPWFTWPAWFCAVPGFRWHGPAR